MTLVILLNNSYWEILHTKEKGKGIFAKREISPGTVISDYIGKVIKIAEEDTSEKDGLYLLYYHDHAALYPEDLKKEGAHMINHSCEPNCWIYIYKGHTLFFALRKIFPGEELTISYQLSPDRDCNPCTHACYCQSNFCTGSMHLSEKTFATWNTFSENQAKQTKRAPIRYGKPLKMLTHYPNGIEDNTIYTLFGNTQIDPFVMNIKQLPDMTLIRKTLRDTGRTILIPNLATLIIGVKNNQLILRQK